MISRVLLRLLLVSGFSSYAVGVLAAAAATGLQLVFRDFFLQVPFLLYFPATILASFVGGWRAGLTCSALALVAASLFFIGSPRGALIDIADGVRLLLFTLICTLIVGVLYMLQTLSQQLLSERELVRMLAREANHRISNSLQMIVSALQLQRSASQSPDVKEALAAARSRVAAIARVHRRLQDGTPTASLQVGAYLRDLCKDIGDQAGDGARLIVNCADFDLPVDRAVKLGLVVNEMLLNAFKHGGSTGEIKVECRDLGNSFALTISDGGLGFPPRFDPAASKGLGMRLISALTQEMGGALDIRRAEGRTLVEITVSKK
jgi:two-component system, sensor histidine kinase PdtaS